MRQLLSGSHFLQLAGANAFRFPWRICPFLLRAYQEGSKLQGLLTDSRSSLKCGAAKRNRNPPSTRRPLVDHNSRENGSPAPTRGAGLSSFHTSAITRLGPPVAPLTFGPPQTRCAPFAGETVYAPTTARQPRVTNREGQRRQLLGLGEGHPRHEELGPQGAANRARAHRQVEARRAARHRRKLRR
jgi:hypothetical protein